jgi:hypothetical protein
LRAADDLCGLGPAKLVEASEPLGIQPDAVKNSNLAMDTLKVVFTEKIKGQGVFVLPILRSGRFLKAVCSVHKVKWFHSHTITLATPDLPVYICSTPEL